MLTHTKLPLDVTAQVRLETITAGHSTLERLLSWCMGQTPPLHFAAMIAQDEFTSDVIVPFEGLYLVYDIT
jgi:hypothetical protein